ncbi:hypothetical protein GGR55DRAFT_622433 [Xylaria sp. FL0064]|nr:hypothetical protein GGR55DRAFT_622433 [Xylaria sp. FL0064]
MLPPSECISQLKWQWFSQQPRRLIDIEHFDAASRGPWGSLRFLCEENRPRQSAPRVDSPYGSGLGDSRGRLSYGRQRKSIPPGITRKYLLT